MWFIDFKYKNIENNFQQTFHRDLEYIIKKKYNYKVVVTKRQNFLIKWKWYV